MRMRSNANSPYLTERVILHNMSWRSRITAILACISFLLCTGAFVLLIRSFWNSDANLVSWQAEKYGTTAVLAMEFETGKGGAQFAVISLSRFFDDGRRVTIWNRRVRPTALYLPTRNPEYPSPDSGPQWTQLFSMIGFGAAWQNSKDRSSAYKGTDSTKGIEVICPLPALIALLAILPLQAMRRMIRRRMHRSGHGFPIGPAPRATRNPEEPRAL
jgi:hypothetical protein